MTGQVSLASGRSFECREDETVLAAAERAGVSLAYSCRVGRCSTCKATVGRGDTRALAPELGLEADERDAGSILTCVRAAIGDVALVEDSEVSTALPKVRTVPCRIDGLVRLSPDVLEVSLRTPPLGEWTYLAGQHLELTGPSGTRRAYSIANARRTSDRVYLHIREVPGGAFSDYWFGSARTEDLLRFRGPLGTFFVRGETAGPLVFIATGTGVAPVNAMLEELALEESVREDVHIYYGARTAQDLYWRPLSSPYGGWRMTPVLSRPDAGWTGRTGYVQDVLAADGVDLSAAEVYACGSEAMITASRAILVARGLSSRHFYSDAFVSSAPALESS